MDNLKDKQSAWLLIFISWIISCLAMGGSLFFSEVMEFPPCILCWYQRIAMYPLVLIFFIGLFPINKDVFKFSFPLITLGWIVALWHNLLHFGIIKEELSPCREGVACSTVYINWLGFITIPILSLLAFSLLGIILYIFYRRYIR
jgi:disulfide bond formation protein DsbB